MSKKERLKRGKKKGKEMTKAGERKAKQRKEEVGEGGGGGEEEEGYSVIRFEYPVNHTRSAATQCVTRHILSPW